jgi:hypothetical protein
MSDRQYRQRGYQDDPRDKERQQQRPGQGPRPPRDPRDRPEGPKTPNLMASHEVSRCARCGHLLSTAIEADTVCERCGTALHSCVQCVSFDPGSPLECTQPIKVRVSPKDERNTCTFFAPRTAVERQTSTARPSSARQAFDDLFKF